MQYNAEQWTLHLFFVTFADIILPTFITLYISTSRSWKNEPVLVYTRELTFNHTGVLRSLKDTWFRPPFGDLLMLQLMKPVLPNLPYLFLDFSPWIPLGTFSILLTASLKPLNGIKRILTGSNVTTFSTKFVFEPVEKRRWPPQLLTGWAM